MDNTARTLRSTHRHEGIPGWGVDLRAEDRPGIPKELNQETTLSPNHHEPIGTKQVPGLGIQLTLERGSYPPVFGTSVRPKPVSNAIRDFAFRYSEDKLRHWILLLFADRVNMVEGWVEDIAHGKAPMLLPRMEFRTTDHLRRVLTQGPKNKRDLALVASVAAVTVGAAALLYLAVSKGRESSTSSRRSIRAA